ALEIDPGYTLAHRELGRVYLSLGRLAEAVFHLQTADHQVPGHEPTQTALREASRRLQAADTTLVELKKRADENPEDVSAELALVRRMRELGMVREALDRLAEREKAFASSAEWQREYAVTLVLGGRIDRAIERYRASLKRNPRDGQAAVELAMLLLERRGQGDIDEAWHWAQQAEQAAGPSPNVLVCQAEILALRGDLEGAIERYGRVLAMLPPDSAQRHLFEQRARALGWKPRSDDQ
ncbi:MAG: hypothetical protein D6788_01935, partial [Planctomycetota bacterium]